MPNSQLHQMSMKITVGDIVDALHQLGGEAHARDIAAFLVAKGEPMETKTPEASVRARLQEHCSDYRAFKDRGDLFESERGSGVWQLRGRWVRPKPTEQWLAEDKAEFDADWGVVEGRKRLRQHLRSERNATLVKRFKASLTDKRCEACELNLTDIYGDLATDYIEAHHRSLLANSGADTVTTLADLAALCPNCHRIIHKNYPMSVEALRDLLLDRGSLMTEMADVRQQGLTWRQAVRQALHRVHNRTNSKTFSRQQLLKEELQQIIMDASSQGKTPEQTISRALQELRDMNEITFTDKKGFYSIFNLK